MADSTEFGDVGSNEEPSGFFGKYLKKHRDAKKAATAQVLAEEKETREALIAKMNEKIKADAAPENKLFSSSDNIDKPQSNKKLTLSERTALKFTQQQSQRKDELQAGKGIAAEM